jgi:hypothetical protein
MDEELPEALLEEIEVNLELAEGDARIEATARRLKVSRQSSEDTLLDDPQPGDAASDVEAEAEEDDEDAPIVRRVSSRDNPIH